MAPEKRAELVVRKLELFIRKGRSAEGGVAFSKWQQLAMEEIIKACIAAEREGGNREALRNSAGRMILIGAVAAVSTIGFWLGVAYDRGTDGIIGSIAVTISILVITVAGWSEWRRRKRVAAARAAFREKMQTPSQVVTKDGGPIPPKPPETLAEKTEAAERRLAARAW